MEELSAEELEEIMRAPQPRGRKPRKIERSLHSWFYDISTSQGRCDNPDCSSPQKGRILYVWMQPDTGLNMCRWCWLDRWQLDEQK